MVELIEVQSRLDTSNWSCQSGRLRCWADRNLVRAARKPVSSPSALFHSSNRTKTNVRCSQLYLVEDDPSDRRVVCSDEGVGGETPIESAVECRVPASRGDTECSNEFQRGILASWTLPGGVEWSHGVDPSVHVGSESATPRWEDERRRLFAMYPLLFSSSSESCMGSNEQGTRLGCWQVDIISLIYFKQSYIRQGIQDYDMNRELTQMDGMVGDSMRGA